MPAAFTETWYAGLPSTFRAYDVAGELLGFLDGLGIEADELEQLIDRIDKLFPGDPGYPGDSTSDLVDPTSAPAEWLSWMAMLYGVLLDRQGAPASFAGTYGQLSIDYPTYALLDAAFTTYSAQEQATTPAHIGLTEDEQRVVIAERPGWRAGSTGAIRALVQSVLIGTQSVTFDRGYGGSWATVRVITYTAETPYPWQVAALLARPGVAPAHVELVYATYDGASYGELSADFATYSDLDAAFTTYDAQGHYIP